MNRGILFAALIALVGSGLATACRRAADPIQLAATDSLITVVEAASLTLNELDVTHYRTADSILATAQPLFLDRFSDTLDRPTAVVIGDQFLQLREAGRMAQDHEALRIATERILIRLNDLRVDLVHGALNKEEGRNALVLEKRRIAAIDTMVHQVIAHYRTTQRVLERQPMVDSLLADTGATHDNR